MWGVVHIFVRWELADKCSHTYYKTISSISRLYSDKKVTDDRMWSLPRMRSASTCFWLRWPLFGELRQRSTRKSSLTKSHSHPADEKAHSIRDYTGAGKQQRDVATRKMWANRRNMQAERMKSTSQEVIESLGYIGKKSTRMHTRNIQWSTKKKLAEICLQSSPGVWEIQSWDM